MAQITFTITFRHKDAELRITFVDPVAAFYTVQLLAAAQIQPKIEITISDPPKNKQN